MLYSLAPPLTPNEESVSYFRPGIGAFNRDCAGYDADLLGPEHSNEALDRYTSPRDTYSLGRSRRYACVCLWQRFASWGVG